MSVEEQNESIHINGLNVKDLTKKENEIVMACIRKYFYTKMPSYNKLSNTKKMKRINKGKTIANMGLEGAYETMLEMFKKGVLKINIVNKENYTIYTISDNDILILHREENGLVII